MPRTQRGAATKARRKAGTARPRRQRGGSTPRVPLLSPEQRRELGGVGLIGSGLVLAVVLLLPGGGSIARPLHDGLFAFLGVGAWLAAVALVVAGVRVVEERTWTGGVLGGIGCVLTIVATLGLVGLVAGGPAGWVGQRVGPGLAHRLGTPGAGAALLVLACLALVLALELRTREVAAALARWWEEHLALPPEELESALPAERPGRAVIEAVGRRERPVQAAREPLELDLEPVEIALSPTTTEPSPRERFPRQFEALPVDNDTTPPPSPPVLASVGGDMAVTADDEPEKEWVLPTIDLFDIVSGKRERLEQEIRTTAATIESTLAAFNIDAWVSGVNSGPTVTQYELQPGKGVPVRKIVAHQTDLSLALAAHLRIQAPIPGKAAIGIEVPNKSAQLVPIRQVVSSPAFTEIRSRLAVCLGADVSGHPVAGDLTRMPHMLIAGATGSGKSVCINAMLAGFLLQSTPAELKLILIDPKRVELSNFADLPHLLVPVVVEPESAVASLRWAVKEMEQRYKLFASHGARNVVVFNERAPGLGVRPLPYILVVIDELADLMMVAAGEIEDLICRVAQLARAVGIHLIVATQRPSADIITGLIKANIPSRVAFAVSSGVDSRVILDEMGAEKLLGRGDMLYLPIDEGKPRRLQGAYVSDRELERLVGFWREQGRPDYQEEIFRVEATVSWARDAGKRDPLFAKAAHTVAAEGRAAASLLQRKLNVGYTRAARLIDQLAEHRVVGPYEGSKSREVLMDVLQVDALLEELGEE